MQLKSLIAMLLILIIVVFALFYASPALMKITGLDYAIFQYSGQEILQGKLPYVDFFDHKPPAMFYLNALALGFFNGSRWGIWVFEVVAVSAAAILSYFFLKEYFGDFAAFFASIAFVINLTFFHDGGNLTEEFALPLQFAILFLLGRWAEGKKYRLNAFLMGLLAGITSSLKQPLGGILIAVFVFMLVCLLTDKNIKRLLISCAGMIAGLAVIWGGWVLYFSIIGILMPFWEGAFAFNFAYTGISTAQRFAAFVKNIRDLFGTSPYYMLGLISYIVCIPAALLSSKAVFRNLTHKLASILFFLIAFLGIYNGLFRRGLMLYSIEQIGTRQIVEIILGTGFAILGWAWLKTSLPMQIRNYLDAHFSVSYEQIHLPLIICLVDLPVQFLLISLSGRSYGHYFMSVLPSLTILCAMFLWFLRTKLKDQMRIVWAAVFLIPLFVPGITDIVRKTRFSEDAVMKQLSDYVIENSGEDDEVFIWSNRVQVYIESGRTCSSKYFFLSPLFLDRYDNYYHTHQLLMDFEENPAKLIIASSNIKRPFFYMEDAGQCKRLTEREELKALSESIYGQEVFIPEGMPEVYKTICENYTNVEPQSDELKSYGMYFLTYTPNRK